MVIEYLNLTGRGGFELQPEFLAKSALVALAGVALAAMGFKIKGAWGAIIAILVGVVLFLGHEGVIRFDALTRLLGLF